MQQADKPWLARLKKKKKKDKKKHKSGSGCGSVGFAIARVRGLAGCVIPGRAGQGRAGTPLQQPYGAGTLIFVCTYVESQFRLVYR